MAPRAPPSLMSEIEKYSGTAIALLKQLISTPSFSKEENATAELIGAYLSKKRYSLYADWQ